ncbi:histidine phosphatase family protein [Sphingomonas oleivorans]|uniref:histidine phosphatase family protein n=1 Tax=Sphingomonas oleivorans TaxID=1735121 RepID=UPI003C6FB395
MYLVRHGQTEYNAQGRLQGRLDSPLTELGIAQATNIGRALRALIKNPDGWTIESSPLTRARRTAEIIRTQIGIGSDIVLDDRLREVSLGSWDGLTGPEIDALWPGARIASSVRLSWIHGCQDGETFQAATARLTEWLMAADDRKNHIVVSHGIAGSLLRGIYAGLSAAEMLRLPVPQDAFFELDDRRIRRIDCSVPTCPPGPARPGKFR